LRQDHGGVEAALLDGAQHGRGRFLGVRAARRPIAAADLARDDGRTERVFGALEVLESLAPDRPRERIRTAAS
jgi:hypothetical protein